MVDSHQVLPGVYVGQSLIPDAHRDIMVRVVNTAANAQKMAAGMCFGNLSAVAVVDESDTRNHTMVDAPGPSDASSVDNVTGS